MGKMERAGFEGQRGSDDARVDVSNGEPIHLGRL
jgi:hypothetical protein